MLIRKTRSSLEAEVVSHEGKYRKIPSWPHGRRQLRLIAGQWPADP
jgi:hypothetical protein